MSPTRISLAGIFLRIAREPAGIVGDIEPVLNMMRLIPKTTETTTMLMLTTPPTAAIHKKTSLTPFNGASLGFITYNLF